VEAAPVEADRISLAMESTRRRSEPRPH
jgi:hypothetical protein